MTPEQHMQELRRAVIREDDAAFLRDAAIFRVIQLDPVGMQRIVDDLTRQVREIEDRHRHGPLFRAIERSKRGA